jgi:hypothetical protein
MSESEEIWRAKSDDELLEAREDLSEYTEEGERIIRAELQRRGFPKPDPPIGSCPSCGRPIARYHQGDKCSQCGEPLPPDILRALGAAAIESTDDMTMARMSDGESLTVNWELVRCVGASFSLQRAKIPGGWLVANGSDSALAFVPDAEHKWNENSS